MGEMISLCLYSWRGSCYGGTNHYRDAIADSDEGKCGSFRFVTDNIKEYDNSKLLEQVERIQQIIYLVRTVCNKSHTPNLSEIRNRDPNQIPYFIKAIKCGKFRFENSR